MGFNKGVINITTEKAIRDIFGIEENEIIDDSEYEYNLKVKNDFKKRKKQPKEIYEIMDNVRNNSIYWDKVRNGELIDEKTIIPNYIFNNLFLYM